MYKYIHAYKPSMWFVNAIISSGIDCKFWISCGNEFYYSDPYAITTLHLLMFVQQSNINKEL